MKKGFTILELLVVIMVISILIGIALPRFKGMQDEGNIAKAKGELRTLQVALESYYIHNANAYPTGLATLTAATPAILTTIPNDPFNSAAVATAYGYVRAGTGSKFYVIFSGGINATCVASFTASNVVSETDTSCIYVSNASQDSVP